MRGEYEGPTMSAETETLGTKVDTEVKRQFRVKAAKENTTMSDYLRQLVEDDLEE